MKKSAFTLIELLVVISIIAVLAGIALPVFKAAQEKARAVKDSNNLKQLGTGILAYLNDNDDQMFSTTATTSWPVTLQSKYVTDNRAFLSPFDPNTSRATLPDFPVSYGFNSNTMDTNMSTYVSLSSIIMMAPAITLNQQNQTWTGMSSANVTISTPQPTDPLNGTHSNKKLINALFGDTHVETMVFGTPGATTQPTTTYTDSTSNPNGLRRWFPTGVKP